MFYLNIHGLSKSKQLTSCSEATMSLSTNAAAPAPAPTAAPCSSTKLLRFYCCTCWTKRSNQSTATWDRLQCQAWLYTHRPCWDCRFTEECLVTGKKRRIQTMEKVQMEATAFGHYSVNDPCGDKDLRWRGERRRLGVEGGEGRAPLEHRW